MVSKRLATVLTGSDWFCGAGGTTEGAMWAGLEMRAAANHWDLAIETHNTNHPNVDHYLTNLSQADPRYFPRTNILMASPECTNHSLAKGCKRVQQGQLSFDGFKGALDPAEERSRATMWCVPRFAEYHDYEVIIVENVVDVRYWRLWDAWIHAMRLLDYEYELCYFNSMFFHPVNGLSDYAPQSRDRIYVVFWKKGNLKPDLGFRPAAWCGVCEANIEAVQSWKKPHKRWGRYGERRQYVYCCPVCAGVVEPYYYAAWNAIDWNISAPRIGDRKRPLKKNTLRRIEIGLEKYGRQSLVIQTDRSHAKNNRSFTLGQALPTQTARQNLAFLVDIYGLDGQRKPVGLDGALPTLHTTPTFGLVSSPFMVEMHGGNDARTIEQPLHCVLAGGNHHGVVIPQPFVTSYYGGSDVNRGVVEAASTITTVDRMGLVAPQENLKVEDCSFRMLQPHEIKDAMGFRPEYVLLGTKRQQVKLAGNAVTPPVMEWLVRQCIKTLV